MKGYFNPRSPCGERLISSPILTTPYIFQSTLPMRGATPSGHRSLAAGHGISIHAPHAGSDRRAGGGIRQGVDFNPRSPCGERQSGYTTCPFCKISIHAPHAGSDLDLVVCPQGAGNFNPRSPCGERRYLSPFCRQPTYFNPRSPCGERPSRRTSCRASSKFQSTLPMRGAT